MPCTTASTPQELEHDLSDAFHDRVIVSRERDDDLPLCRRPGAGRKGAGAGRAAARRRTERRSRSTSRRWHPDALEWRAGRRAAARRRRRAEQPSTRRESHAERKRVRGAGLPAVRGAGAISLVRGGGRVCRAPPRRGPARPSIAGSYVLVGATDEDARQGAGGADPRRGPGRQRGRRRGDPAARSEDDIPQPVCLPRRPRRVASTASVSSVRHEEGPHTRLDRVDRNAGAGGDRALAGAAGGRPGGRQRLGADGRAGARARRAGDRARRRRRGRAAPAAPGAGGFSPARRACAS